MQYIALLPWLLFFSVYSLNAYLEMYENNKDDLTFWLKDNFLQMFRVDVLFLIVIFVYFMKYDNLTVNLMLFFMINLYLFINSLYDIPKKLKIKKIIMSIILPYIILMTLPILYFLLTKNFGYTCILMFTYTFFAYIIVIFVKKISNYIANFLAKIKKAK